MESTRSLKQNHLFRRLYQKGKSASGHCVVVYCRKNGLPYNRLGLTAGTKLGHAVVRNRTKRRLRECFRPYLGDVKNGLYVFVARPSAAEATFQSLEKSMRYLIRKQGVLKEGNRAQ